jgi:hypothetical protein
MFRRRLALAILLAVLAVPAVAATAAAVADPAPDAVAADPARPVEPERRIDIRLACRATDEGIGCDWSPVDHPRAAGYRLWRAVDVPDPEHHRAVVFRTGDLAHTRFLDTEVRPGHTFHYAVEVVGHGGGSLAWSNTVRVELPPERAQDLALRCEGVRRTEDHPAGIACGWDASVHPAFAGYRLVRSDGDERIVVFRTGDRAVTRYLDIEVRPGATYLYAVEAVTADGRVVGVGGPVRATAPEPPAPESRPEIPD